MKKYNLIGRRSRHCREGGERGERRRKTSRVSERERERERETEKHTHTHKIIRVKRRNREIVRHLRTQTR